NTSTTQYALCHDPDLLLLRRSRHHRLEGWLLRGCPDGDGGDAEEDESGNGYMFHGSSIDVAKSISSVCGRQNCAARRKKSESKPPSRCFFNRCDQLTHPLRHGLLQQACLSN